MYLFSGIHTELRSILTWWQPDHTRDWILHSGTVAILERMRVLIVVTYVRCGHVVLFILAA